MDGRTKRGKTCVCMFKLEVGLEVELQVKRGGGEGMNGEWGMGNGNEEGVSEWRC